MPSVSGPSKVPLTKLRGELYEIVQETLGPAKSFFRRYTLQLGYPISLLTLKTAPPCPSKDLRGPAPGHPEVYRVNPDLPRPLKRRGPASGSPGWTSGLVLMNSRLPCPVLLRTFGALPRGTPGSYRVNPDLSIHPNYLFQLAFLSIQ